MIRILVHGCTGRLGSAIVKELESTHYRNTAMVCAGVALEKSAHVSFPIYLSLDECDMPADLLIDCSTAEAVPGAIRFALKKNIPLLVCTTGLSVDTLDALVDASERIPLFRSPNMSFGINLIMRLSAAAARSLPDFDVEIIEKHHNQKIDSPSGTALLLSDAINKAVSPDSDAENALVYGRSPESGKRDPGEIGVHAVRGGGIVGDHTVIFAGSDEVIEISHSALTKNVFAQGAVKAALFLAGKPAGIYGMDDLIFI